MPSLLEALHKIVRIFETNDVDYMVIGGWALPAYGQIRATQDVDFAIVMKQPKKLEHLVSELRSNNYQISTANPKINHAMIQIMDKDNEVEMELWLKLDGITMGDKLLKRRLKRNVHDITFWVIGPEDFIINKLSRPDRSPTDEQDVISVLKRQKGKLDREYLEKRAKKTEILQLLEFLEARMEELS